MFTRTCALDGCDVEFQTDNPRKKHCSPQHSTLSRVRRWKAKHRKPRGGGGGNGGGSSPTLFDTIEAQSPVAFVSVPVIGPSRSGQRKPSRRVSNRKSVIGPSTGRRKPSRAA